MPMLGASVAPLAEGQAFVPQGGGGGMPAGLQLVLLKRKMQGEMMMQQQRLAMEQQMQGAALAQQASMHGGDLGLHQQQLQAEIERNRGDLDLRGRALGSQEKYQGGMLDLDRAKLAQMSDQQKAELMQRASESAALNEYRTAGLQQAAPLAAAQTQRTLAELPMMSAQALNAQQAGARAQADFENDPQRMFNQSMSPRLRLKLLGGQQPASGGYDPSAMPPNPFTGNTGAATPRVAPLSPLPFGQQYPGQEEVADMSELPPSTPKPTGLQLPPTPSGYDNAPIGPAFDPAAQQQMQESKIRLIPQPGDSIPRTPMPSGSAVPSDELNGLGAGDNGGAQIFATPLDATPKPAFAPLDATPKPAFTPLPVKPVDPQDASTFAAPAQPSAPDPSDQYVNAFMAKMSGMPTAPQPWQLQDKARETFLSTQQNDLKSGQSPAEANQHALSAANFLGNGKQGFQPLTADSVPSAPLPMAPAALAGQYFGGDLQGGMNKLALEFAHNQNTELAKTQERESPFLMGRWNPAANFMRTFYRPFNESDDAIGAQQRQALLAGAPGATVNSGIGAEFQQPKLSAKLQMLLMERTGMNNQQARRVLGAWSGIHQPEPPVPTLPLPGAWDISN